ncbi:MAG: nitrite/sulfite reductase [Candidatus Bathyarchaeota archaeon]|nr:nitrite/sulfite reductase [Candidatus Bathyarchaeota archaeon]
MAQPNQPPTVNEILKFANRYSLGSEKGEGSQHFLRIKIPNGILTTHQFRKIADLSEKYGRKYAEITDRQDIQLHWIEAEDTPDIFAVLQQLGFTTDKCGQGYPGVGHGDVRNIEGCSVAGVDKNELLDTSPFAKELDRFFTGNKDFQDLPKKIKVSISGCSLNCPAPEAYDLAFMAIKKPSGEVGFIVFVGGTLGSSPHIAQQLKVWVEPIWVVPVTKAVVEIFRDNGRREVKAKSRFRWLVEEWGTDKLRATIEAKLGTKFETYELERLAIKQAEHIGVNPQKQKGKAYITVPILGGVLSAAIIRQLSDLADKYGSGDIRLTPYQNLIIINIPQAEVATVQNKLLESRFPVNGSALRWTTIACAGNFCAKAPESPKGRAKEVIDFLEATNEKFSPNLRIGVSGCPNGCSRHLLADIGVQGVHTTVEGKPAASYNVFVGGGLTPVADLGKLELQGVASDDVKYVVKKFIDAHRSKTLLE